MKAPHVVFQHMIHQPSSIRLASSKSSTSNSSFWERLWERFFILDSQLQVSQKHDRAGSEYYQIDHPLSSQTQVFRSEQDAIAWLDRQRF
jgi:hypothetical protein